MCSCASVIQCRKDSGRSPFFNKVTDNLVVEVFNGRPLNLFSNIFLLFRLESQLYKYLLEFLVDIVDAKLLK